MNKFSTLVKLAKKGDVAKIEEILEQGNANINEVDHKSKQGLIHIAIEHGDEALFHAIVKRHTADLELTTADGETPLEMAVRLNCPAMVQALLEHNVHFRRKNQAGETVLATAIRNQTHKDILKRLTHNKFDVNEPIDEFGSYLNLSVTAGHPDNFYFLVKELGIDYTKKFDSQGNSCLILAVKHNQGDFVVTILQKLKEDPLLTPLDQQFFINHQNNEGNTAIHEAALKGLQTITQKLDEAGKDLGLDVTLRNKKGQTVELIKAGKERERVNEIEMQRRRQEEKVVRKREKNEQKNRQKQDDQRQRVQEARLRKEQQRRISIETKVQSETSKKKSQWVMGILAAIIIGVMYLAFANIIEKKKPVSL